MKSSPRSCAGWVARLSALLLLAGLAPGVMAQAARPHGEPELRAIIQQAIAGADCLSERFDRFDWEVWFSLMEPRLRNIVKDADERLRILEALTIEGDTPVQTIIDTAAGTLRIASRDAAGIWRTHLESGWEPVSAGDTALVELGGDGQGEEVDVAAMLSAIEANGVAYGPAFRGLSEVRRYGNAAVGVVRTAGIPGRERKRYGLHPALLDAAFQLCGACVDAGDAVYLPVSIDSVSAGEGAGVEFEGGLPVSAVLREGDADSAVLVCDVEVAGVLRISGLRFQRARRQAVPVEQRVADWLYVPAWERVELEAGSPVEGSYLVAGRGALASSILEELTSRSVSARLVAPSDLAAELAADSSHAGVIIVGSSDGLDDQAGIEGVLERSLSPFLASVRAAASSSGPPQLVLVTRAAVAIDDQDTVDPVSSALWALGHTAAAEMAQRSVRRIDLGASLTDQLSAAAVVDVLGMPSEEDRLVRRTAGWFAARLERLDARVHSALEDPPAAGETGAVWITGGLAGVGLALALELVKRGQRRLVLTGRSEPSPEAKAAIEGAIRQGAEIMIARGDVSLLEDVERIRDAVLEREWTIDQVFHGAAALDDAVLPRQSWERFARVLAPKAVGAWNLHNALSEHAVRRFVLFSAGAGVLGSPGQAGYAAANGFLDGLAHLRRASGLPATAIAWGPWADVGMAARAGLDWTSSGLRGIDAEGGAVAIDAAVVSGAMAPMVIAVDWPRFPARDAEGEVLPFFSRVAVAETTSASSTGASDWKPLLASTPSAERRKRLEALLASEVVGVMGLSGNRPPAPQVGLMDLGMDSLMSVEIGNRISRSCGLNLPSTFAFERPTIRAMSDYILEEMALNGPADGSGEGASAAPSDDLDALSADEVTSALLDELEQIGY